MMSVQHLALESSPARIALDHARERPESLTWLLRHHDTHEVVHPKELQLRAAFDSLLEFFSLIEVGCTAGEFPAQLPSNFAKLVLAYLANPPMVGYYNEAYPLYLPKALLMRASGKGRQAPLSEAGMESFRKFLSVNAMLSERKSLGWSEMERLEKLGQDISPSSFYEELQPSYDPDDHPEVMWTGTKLFREPPPPTGFRYSKRGDIECFLCMLDSFEIDGYSLDDLLEILPEPTSFVSHLARRKEDQTAVDQSLHGFIRFLDFCQKFDGLLEETNDEPVLKDAMWRFHEYWFRILGDRVEVFFERAFEGIEALRTSTGDSRREARGSISDLRACMARLLRVTELSKTQRMMYLDVAEAMEPDKEDERDGGLAIPE